MTIFKRKIKLGMLLTRGVFYRLFIILCNALFNLIALKYFIQLLTNNLGLAFGYSIIWNLVNTGLYYLYHYIFDRNFKMGRK